VIHRKGAVKNDLRFAGLSFWTCIPFLLALAVPGAAQTYSITDLGTLGGNASGARGINGTGQVTGYAYSSKTQSNVFLYSGGMMTSLGSLGGTNAIGLAINSTGQVAGYSTLSSGSYRGFISINGALKSVGTLGGDYSDAEGINDSQVTGASSTANGLTHPYLWTNGKMTDLGTLPGGNNPGDWNSGEAVNSSGEVVGWGYSNSGFTAILWSNGQIKDLGSLCGELGQAFGINDLGQITGQAYITGGIGADTFLHDNGVMQDLGTITSPTGGNGQYACGFGINSSGLVVGQSTYQKQGSAIVYHAFVYSSGKMRDLNRLIPAHSGWVLTTAYVINDAGEIVGYGTHNKQERAFLLTPQ
jgi:probable HAF family extracellular repeat protein